LSMTTIEGIIVCVVIIAATVASVLGHLDPPLVGLLGIALGYGGGRTVSSISSSEPKR
jgi:hypothetical protein